MSRILFVEHNRSAGTETVAIEVITQLLNLTDRVVLAAPAYRIKYYRSIFPASDKLFYETTEWPTSSGKNKFFRRLDGILRRIDNGKSAVRKIRNRLDYRRLRNIIKDHQLSYAFYPWIVDQWVPKLGIPLGAMIMDLNWHAFPEAFPDHQKNDLDRKMSRWLKEASVVFPISKFTQDQIDQAFPNHGANVEIVPHGASLRDFVNPSPADEVMFFYPASTWANKNHALLMDAVLSLYQKGHNFKLILAGKGTDGLISDEEQPLAWVESARKAYQTHKKLVNGRIEALGFCSREKVEELYQNCTAVVFPTQYEGFGLPLLESLERGAPALCSDIPPFREQVALFDAENQVTLYKVDDQADLEATLLKNIEAGTQQRPGLAEIHQRMSRWTWKKAAEAYLEGLKQIKKV